MHSKPMLKKSMMKKGGIFTIDAILALLIAGAVIVGSFSLLKQDSNPILHSRDAEALSYDSLAVLESSGALSEAVKTNSSSSISLFLNNLPNQFCSNISLYFSNNEMVNSAVKAGCTPSDNAVLARNVFVSQNSAAYYAEMKTWYH